MTFVACVRLCLTRRYADFRSRAGRAEYLCFMGFCGLLACIEMVAIGLLGRSLGVEAKLVLYDARIIAALPVFVPFCSVHVRRMHDMDRGAGPLVAVAILLAANSFLLEYSFWAPVAQGEGLMAALASLKPLKALWMVFPRTVFGLETLAKLATLVHSALGVEYMNREYVLLFKWAAIGYAWFVLVLGLVFAGMLRRGSPGGNRYGPPPAPLTGNAAGTDLLSAMRRCLGSGYADFTGRASRAEFWWFTLVQALLGVTWSRRFPGGGMPSLSLFSVWELPLWIALPQLPQLLLFLPGLAVTVRRLHDRGKSAVWLAGLLVAEALAVGLGLSVSQGPWFYGRRVEVFLVYGLWLLPALVFLCQMIGRGEAGPNKYGPDPAVRAGGAGAEQELPAA